jgi:ATP-dependent DNA helicase RecG
MFQNLRVYAEDQSFKNGAVLFFGKQPEEILDKAIIRCIAFQGQDKRYIIDDKVFGGNLWQQYRQAMQWVRGKLNVRYDIEGQGGGPRKEIWEIPETVFKEAIINALSHRDYYEKGAVIHIEVFDNRVEISNPGGLVSAISEKEFGKKSHSRNPLIFGLFARMQLVEQVGSGIGRMQDLMAKAGLPDVGFRKEGMFTVILQRPPQWEGIDDGKSREKSREKGREKSREKMLEQIRQNPSITMKELSEILQLSPKTIEKQISILKNEGALIRLGPDRGGEWQVVQKPEQ